jgi:hypothetical protein
MEVEATIRDNKPLSFGLTVSFTTEELKAVLEDVSAPDTELYFDLMSDDWDNLTAIERMARTSEVVSLVTEFLKARETNPTLVVETKGTAP